MLSLEFLCNWGRWCATEVVFCVVRSDEIGLIGEEVVVIDVEECCFDVVV